MKERDSPTYLGDKQWMVKLKMESHILSLATSLTKTLATSSSLKLVSFQSIAGISLIGVAGRDYDSHNLKLNRQPPKKKIVKAKSLKISKIIIKKSKTLLILFFSSLFSKASMWQIISDQKLNSQCVNNENSNGVCQCHQCLS